MNTRELEQFSRALTLLEEAGCVIEDISVDTREEGGFIGVMNRMNTGRSAKEPVFGIKLRVGELDPEYDPDTGEEIDVDGLDGLGETLAKGEVGDQ